MAGKWGQGRIEVSFLHDEIEARLSEGCTVRQLYLSLREAGLLTISLSTFSARVAHIADELSPLRQSSSAPNPEPQLQDRLKAARDARRKETQKAADKTSTQMPRFIHDPMQRITFTE